MGVKDWQLRYCDVAVTGATVEERFGRIAEEAAELGFEFCAQGMRFPLPISRPRTSFNSNYEAAWVTRYEAQGYVAVDPTVAHGMRSSAPIVWSDALFAAAPQLWEEAQSFGLRVGWAQSRCDAEGLHSLLVLARSAEPIGASEMKYLDVRLQWLVQASHLAMKMSSADRPAEAPRIELTVREVDVLRWTADGKTASEIADILSLSERTVNFHVSTAVSKLSASNKTSAAVKATIMGLLW